MRAKAKHKSAAQGKKTILVWDKIQPDCAPMMAKPTFDFQKMTARRKQQEGGR